MKVFITAQAEQDLSALRYWIAEDNPERADTFLDELDQRIASLEHWSKRFPIAYASRHGPVRRLVHRGYRILYLVWADRVEVLHVHHGSRAAPSFD
ncbi:type II toxin-antitoxin system RelE/ParE family toxin [Sphingomonas sp.]|uniref:type II toxin-antitoxin system RelE/ParE family toxin n=1 Tax=Sphingomonas sp. TaxID=28214 RepID=UPI002ED8F262